MHEQRGNQRERWKGSKKQKKRVEGCLVEGVKNPPAQWPSTSQICSLEMSLAVSEQSIPGVIMPHNNECPKSQRSDTKLNKSFSNNAPCAIDILSQSTKVYHLARNDKRFGIYRNCQQQHQQRGFQHQHLSSCKSMPIFSFSYKKMITFKLTAGEAI